MLTNLMQMNKKNAFTLIETLIAVTLTTVVITAVTGLILSTLLANQRNLHNLQALYFAKESLETVRFMRDSNWLQNYSWDGGDSLWGHNFDVSSGEKNLYLASEFTLSSDENDGKVTTVDGFTFVRKLTFSPVVLEGDEDTLDSAVMVTATVMWEERGVPKNLSLSTYLTDWQ